MSDARHLADGSLLPPSFCPGCRYRMDAATAAEGDHRPSVGDYSVCLNCGEILRYSAGLCLCRDTSNLADLDEEGRRTIRQARRLIIQRGPIPRMEAP